VIAEPWVSVDDIGALGRGEGLGLPLHSQDGLPAHRLRRLWKFKLSEVDDWAPKRRALSRTGSPDA